MAASAFEIIEVNGIYYEIFDGMNTATVTYARDGISYSGDIVIPDNFNYENKTYDVTSIASQAFLDCSSLNSISIGNNVQRIEYLAFRNCRGLKNVIFPSSLEFIGDDAFQGCSGLQSIEIPNSVTKINSGAFEGCSNLKEIVLPNGLKEIGYRIFMNCSSLATITIPVSVIKIGRQAFNGCESLSEISLPNSVKEIEEYAFKGCDALSSVKLSNNLTYIGKNAFYGCKSLTTIKIPNSVKQIDSNAFERCDYLNTVFLGRGVETIGAKALYGYRLMDVYCAAKTVPSVTNSTFYDSAIENATLHVFEECIDNYKSSDVWKNFKSIVSYAVNTFKLTYIVDNIVYNEYELEEGEEITPEAEPTKEGYTFSGWSEIPQTMPAHDVTVTGTFSVNKYKLTYTVDGTEYKTYEVEYGATITLEAAPTKEGYTFSGWSEIPEIMPAKDVMVTGTFSINKYKLTYTIDGEEYKSYEVEYGATITPEAEPTKEGYTFSGWSEIPETMPAHDVKVTGTFTKGAYKLTYYVDGDVYKTVSYDYGATITPEAEPTKEGYTFSGWCEIPETMPAYDVTVTGTFSINKYKLTYTVDGAEYKTYELEYGATITPEAAPTKEGYTFSGWSEIPEAMPAHDVTVTGTFIINSYKLTYMIDEKVYKEMMYEYGSTIIPEPQPEGDYDTFEWIELPQTMPAHDVVVYASYTSGIIEVLMASQKNLRIYSPNGKKLSKLQKGLNIVILNDGTVKKVMMK